MKQTAKRQPGRWIVIALSLIICHLSFSPAGAQTFTQRLQKSAKGEGKVTLHQDTAIDDLVNGTQAVTRLSAATTPKKNEAEKPRQEQQPKKEEKKEPIGGRENPSHDTKADAEPTSTTVVAVDSTALKKGGKTYKVTGYRIQAFAGGNSRKDKQKAEQTGNQLRMLFPAETVYTHFYSPRWICRMGNYRTYEEAHQMLQEVKKMGFTSATIVKGKISVQY